MLGLLRYQVFLTYGIAFLSVWYYGLTHQEEWDLSASSITRPSAVRLAVTWAPVWAVLALAVVLLTRLILGVLSYRDCPEAARELEQQIEEAKAEMKRRKIL